MQALLALCHLHVVPVWPSRLVTLSSSSPRLLAYRCRPYLLCATCMCCLFGPPDWSVCHPVASSTCLQVQALLALCHLHVLPVWPSRLVSLSSSSLFYWMKGAGPTCSAWMASYLQDAVNIQCNILVPSNLDVKLGAARMPALSSVFAICSMNTCAWAIHIHTHVTANQVPALYVLSAYNVIAGVDPDPSIQATKTFLSRLAINLTYVPHCTRLYLTRCNTVDSRYRRAQLSALYREVPLIQR